MSASATSALVPPESGEKRVGIFVSHKHDDRLAAMHIKSRFEELGGDRLDVYVSELIPTGEQWDPKIHQWLKESDWLLLLYTGPGVEWDWCLYETGFFAGSHETNTKRLVCLHREGVELPGPLKGWEAATEENCEGLLDEIFRKTSYPGGKPLNSRVADQTLKGLAREIMDGFTDKPKPTVFTPYVELLVEDRHKRELLSTRKLPGDIAVTLDGKAREIFGVADTVRGQTVCWADIAAGLERTRQKGWIRGLSDSVRRLCEKQSVSTTFPVVYSVTDGAKRRWRPILYSAQVGGSAQALRIVLSEILPEDDPRPSDPRLDHCTVLMTMSRMIRFGIIDKYRPLVRQLQMRKKTGGTISPEEMEVFEAIPPALDRMETEAINSGVQTLDSVIALFGADQAEQGQKLESWTSEWMEYRKQVLRAVTDRNLDQLENALNGMRDVNRDGLRLIAHRFSELIDELQ